MSRLLIAQTHRLLLTFYPLWRVFFSLTFIFHHSWSPLYELLGKLRMLHLPQSVGPLWNFGWLIIYSTVVCCIVLEGRVMQSQCLYPIVCVYCYSLWCATCGSTLVSVASCWLRFPSYDGSFPDLATWCLTLMDLDFFRLSISWEKSLSHPRFLPWPTLTCYLSPSHTRPHSFLTSYSLSSYSFLTPSLLLPLSYLNVFPCSTFTIPLVLPSVLRYSSPPLLISFSYLHPFTSSYPDIFL